MWQANMTKIGDTNEFAEPYEVIFRIQRGLTGLISYLAAAESNTIFNEALLYEPTLRIFAAKKYGAECEVVCQGVEQPARGDKRKIDFLATNQAGAGRIALEIKWPRKNKTTGQFDFDVSNDVEKLRGTLAASQADFAFLCVFGIKSVLEEVAVNHDGFEEALMPQYADLWRTVYGCRVFQLRTPAPAAGL